MLQQSPNDAEKLGLAAPRSVRDHWQLFLMEGIALIVLGLLALVEPAFASLAATIFIGWLLLISGGIGLIASFRARRAPGFAWSLISAILAVTAGVLLLNQPLDATLSLTGIVIAFLIIEGILSMIYALAHRGGQSARWSWMLVSGLLDIVLGGILLAGLPGTALWALGVLIGINMIFGGTSLVAMALHARPAKP